MDQEAIRNLAYLVASILFIFGLKGLTHPRTARRGNLIGSLAMLLAVVVTLVTTDILSWPFVAIALVIGAVIGTWFALTVPMTGMPQMVALFNGFGGGASVFVAGAAMWMVARAVVPESAPASQPGEAASMQMLVATSLSGLIGAVTFFGSLIALLKLQEKYTSMTIAGRKIRFGDALLVPGRHLINLVLFGLCVWLCVKMVQTPDSILPYVLLVLCASVLGVMITIPIGGADMPVVIALLNSYSGLAACATGFVIENNVLIIAGALVGASGLILTSIMCKAMNRSLPRVMFATLGPAADGPSADEVYAGKIKETSADEVAMVLDGASRVAIVPGYGLAVAQAQHAVRDLSNALKAKGTEVVFGIHPVAGRMPGHMNVLLAEADIPYDDLLELDTINPTFQQTDVVLVVGANDVINPSARESDSPISGMPILDVDKARTVVVIKRSLSPGFAGIPNPLFANDNTLMLFSDAKKAFVDLLAAYKENA